MAGKKKNAKNMSSKKWLWGVLALVLIAAIVIFVVINNQNAKPKAVMEMSTNPSVQVVLDGNDKVVAEIALNSDGEKLLANVSFMGLKADVAAKTFAQVANEMDKINDSKSNVPTYGRSTIVQINISAESAEEYKELAQKAQDAVNKYFSDNGIFAGAVTEVNSDIKETLTKMGVSASEYANKTTAELLDYVKNKSNELEEFTLEARDQLTVKFDELYDSILSAADEAMETAKKLYEEAPETTKSLLKDSYEKAVEFYNEQKAKLDKQYNAVVEELRTNCQEALATLKAEAKKAYETTTAAVKARIEEFKNLTDAQKEAMQEQISTFQQNLLSK